MKRELENKMDMIYSGDRVAKQFEYLKWTKEIPYLRFQNDWDVKIVPPFANTIVRFRVKKGTKEVSVYLDCYNLLGYSDGPYWEIYPYEDDTFRCDINETDKLIKAIKTELGD